MMSVTAIVGANWGDEGKGKIQTYWLHKQAMSFGIKEGAMQDIPL